MQINWLTGMEGEPYSSVQPYSYRRNYRHNMRSSNVVQKSFFHWFPT